MKFKLLIILVPFLILSCRTIYIKGVYYGVEYAAGSTLQINKNRTFEFVTSSGLTQVEVGNGHWKILNKTTIVLNSDFQRYALSIVEKITNSNNSLDIYIVDSLSAINDDEWYNYTSLYLSCTLLDSFENAVVCNREFSNPNSVHFSCPVENHIYKQLQIGFHGLVQYRYDLLDKLSTHFEIYTHFEDSTYNYRYFVNEEFRKNKDTLFRAKNNSIYIR